MSCTQKDILLLLKTYVKKIEKNNKIRNEISSKIIWNKVLVETVIIPSGGGGRLICISLIPDNPLKELETISGP